MALNVAKVEKASESDLSTVDARPELTYHLVPADAEDERTEALRLVADSIAQQRQTAARALILHPLSIAITILVIALSEKYLDRYTLLTTIAGILMTGLVGVRTYTASYITQAERVSFSWLDDLPILKSSRATGAGRQSTCTPDTKEPFILTAHYNNEIIGSLIYYIHKVEERAIIRAWTVKLRFRRKGVGRGLLEAGVRRALQQDKANTVEFESRHANSLRIFPTQIPLLAGLSIPTGLNSAMDKREKYARDVLKSVVSEEQNEKKSPTVMVTGSSTNDSSATKRRTRKLGAA